MADIREQNLALKTTLADTDWLRLVTKTGNHRMTVGQFKDSIGYTALQQRTQDLEDGVNTLIDEVNKIKPSLVFSSATLIPYTTDYLQALACECNVSVSGEHIIIQVGHTASNDTRGDRKYFIQPNGSIGLIQRDQQQSETIESKVYYRAVGTKLMLFTQQNTPVYIRKIWIASSMFK